MQQQQDSMDRSQAGNQSSQLQVLTSDPSQMSFKQIQALFINPVAKKMTVEIKDANKHIGSQTKSFERELRQLEHANAIAQQEDNNLKLQIKQTKRTMRGDKTVEKKDFLTVIATPQQFQQDLESVKSLNTDFNNNTIDQPRIFSPSLARAKLRKSSIAVTNHQPIKLPAIDGVRTRNKRGHAHSIEPGQSYKTKKMRPHSLFGQVAHKDKQQEIRLSQVIKNSGDVRREKHISSIYIKDCTKANEEEGAGQDTQEQFDSTVKKQSLVSFGRRIIPRTDRAAERKQIIERRKHLDSLIASGLKASGIEMDAQEKRFAQLLESTASSNDGNLGDNNATAQGFLPNINGADGSPLRLGMQTFQTEKQDETQNEIFGNGSPDGVGDSTAGNGGLILRQTEQNFSPDGKRRPKRKTRIGLVINFQDISPRELRAHREQLQILKNRKLRETQEKMTGDNKSQRQTNANRTKSIFAPTEMNTGTFYSVTSTVQGPQTAWQLDGKFAKPVTLDAMLQKKVLQDYYSFDDEQVEDFINDPRLLALAQIKFMNNEDKDKEKVEKERQIVDMVAYLLNQASDDEKVELISSRLLDKVYSPEYNMFVQDKNQLTSDYAFEVRDKKLFIDLCKNSQKPRLVENSKMNYLLRYHQDCLKQNVVPLPLLFKVRDKRLVLKGYRLNQGLCLSLKHALEIYPTLLTSIKLSDNGISDFDLSKVMNGIGCLESIKEIHIESNIFLNDSFQQLEPILKRSMPANLETLKLVSVRTGPLVAGMITGVLAEACNLRNLTLANAQLSDINITDLCTIIKSARFLIELDISSNKITPQRMLELSRVLAENRQLESINLSFNSFTQYFSMKDYIQGVAEMDLEENEKLVSQKDMLIHQERDISIKIEQPDMESSQRNLLDFANATRGSTLSLNSARPRSNQSKSQTQSRLQVPGSQTKLTGMERNKQIWSNYEYLLDQENSRCPNPKVQKEIVANICKMVKRNKHLLHLDLSQTQLTEYMLWHIGRALSRARSVISLHLSGNQGITPTLIEQLQTRIRCIPYKQKNKIGLERGIDKSSIQYRTQKGRFKKHDEDVLQEKMRLRQIQKFDISTCPDPLLELSKTQLKLIFQRKLGHKPDMPGSGQWQCLDDSMQSCWHCDNHIYTLVFWSKDNGEQDDTIDPVFEENLINQVEQENNFFEDDPIVGPRFFTDKTSWRPTKLRTVEDFFYDVDKSKPDIKTEMISKGQCREEVESVNDMNEKELQKYTDLVERYKYSNYTSSDDIKKIILRDFVYKHMQLVNVDLLDKLNTGEADEEQHRIYVFAQIFKPGKQTYMTCLPDEQMDLTFYAHKIINGLRVEPVPRFEKNIRTTAIVRNFDKDASVFAEWTSDNETTVRQCMEHDLKLWHADKFIKDEEDREATADVMRKYAKEIKNMFIQLACRSSFPQLGFMDFGAFSNQVQLPDERGTGTFAASQIDTQFIAANNGTVAMAGMDVNILARYKFVEIIARIAQSKYTNQQRAATTAEAVEKLMTEVILKKYKWEPWQDYREEHCYTLEVNDVLETNIAGIKGLIEYYYAPRKSYMKQDDFLRLITKDSNCQIGEKEAVYCYGMSKMTIVNELKQSKQYDKVELPEMCEMICRLADTKFKSATGLSYAQKIEVLLDELFVVTGYKRKDVNVQQEEQSESDDEY